MIYIAGGSIDPAINSQLRLAIDNASKQKMPKSTIQNTLKKCSTINQQLKKQLFELRVGTHGQIFAIVILYSDNIIGARMQLMQILKKFAAIITDCRHLFYEKGIIDAYGTTELFANIVDNNNDKMDEIILEHAIESNAEEYEIVNETTKQLMVIRKIIKNQKQCNIYKQLNNIFFQFICDPSDIEKCKQKLSSIGYRIENSEHIFIPNVSDFFFFFF